MKFSDQRLIGGDASPLPVTQLQQILQAAGSVDRAQPNMAGLDDLAEQMHIAHEFMLQLPQVLFKELKRERNGLSIDPLYGEPAQPGVHGRAFLRSLWLHTYATYSDPEFKYDKTGTQFNQPLTVWWSTLELYLHNFFPEMGDEMIYLGRPYQLTNVFIPANAVFLQTGLPVYVAANAEVWRHGDGVVPTHLGSAGLSQAIPNPATAALQSRLAAGVSRVTGL